MHGRFHGRGDSLFGESWGLGKQAGGAFSKEQASRFPDSSGFFGFFLLLLLFPFCYVFPPPRGTRWPISEGSFSCGNSPAVLGKMGGLVMCQMYVLGFGLGISLKHVKTISLCCSTLCFSCICYPRVQILSMYTAVDCSPCGHTQPSSPAWRWGRISFHPARSNNDQT